VPARRSRPAHPKHHPSPQPQAHPLAAPESLAKYARFFFKSLALALTHRFDAIHAFRALPEGLVAWLVARLSFRPVVIYAHGEELTTWGRAANSKPCVSPLRHPIG